MITLYRHPEDAWADEIQDLLDDMVIAYETETVPPEANGNLPEDVSALPALRDDDEVLTDKTAIRERLDALEQLMADWDRFQSDACYLDEDGNVC